MSVDILFWDSLHEDKKNRFLKRSEINIDEIEGKVRSIIERVKNEGDAALFHFTKDFDNIDIAQQGLRAKEKEFASAEKELPQNVKSAIKYSIENVKTYHKNQVPKELRLSEIKPGILAGERPTPIDSVGLYVPRGRGSFPSMLYMLAVPASIAGVPRIVVVTPPNPDGSIDPACLYTARLCGVNEVYRVGGAQAVAALGYGTETIEKVVKIIGPGSKYVAAAKRIVSSFVDTGLPAGPSESIILADETPDPRTIALDLLVEAEHGSDSSAILITSSKTLAEKAGKVLPDMINKLPEPRKTFVQDVFSGYGGIIVTENIEKAGELVNTFAPEHLQIRTADPFQTLSGIRNAGEILLGEHVPFSAANYSIGANAVLPTGGMAKSYSPVSVRDFIKYSSVVYVSKEGYTNLKEPVITLADYEGFITHGNALKQRNI